MKLSNKILIGFFGFIFIYMTAAFTEIRFRGTSNFIDFSNIKSESVDIPGVHFMVLEVVEQNVTVIGSDNAKLEVQSGSGDLLQKLKYEMSGDTLFIKQWDVEKNDPRIRISVHVPKDSLKGLMIRNAWVDIKNLKQKVLSVSQIQGTIRMYDNQIGKLNLETSNDANFHLHNTVLDTLVVQLENADIQIDSHVKLLEGSMKNSSHLQVQGPDEIQLKKDESSRIQFN